MVRPTTTAPPPPTPPRRLVDYYRFLGVPRDATTDSIVAAYLGKVQDADGPVRERAEQALAVLSHPAHRAAYDRDLAAGQGAAAGGPRPAQRAGEMPVRPVGSRPPGVPGRRTGGRTYVESAPPATVINLDWRWALAAIPVLLLLGVLLFGNAKGGGGPSSGAAVGANTLAQAIPAVIGTDGVQTLNVLVNGDTFQYEPKVIKVKQGVPVHFNLSVKGDPG